MISRTDDNQPDIVRMYRELGCSVTSLHKVGKGCPDLLIGVAGQTDVAEVKDGNKSPSRRKLTPDQVEWHGEWMGSVEIVTCLEDVIRHVGNMRTKSRLLAGEKRWPLDNCS